MSVLKQRYGISDYTVRRLIANLTADRTLVPYKHGYLVPLAEITRSYATVPFIGAADNQGRLLVASERINQGLFTLDIQARATGINFIRWPLHSSGKGISQLRRLRSRRGDLGYLVWTNGMTAQDITELLDTILSLHKPVALVDEIGDFTIPLQAAANPLLKVFTIAAATAGMQVARYLRNLGHRRIAYITPYSDQQWSQRRCRGLIDIFEKAGMVPDRVPAAAQSGVSVHTAGPWDVSDPKARKLIESFLSAYERGIHAGIRSFLLQAVDFDGGLFRAYEGMRVALVQQFERVLNDRHVSAWVLPNDVCAYFAHDFLTSRGVAVPRAMSVIGFDDTKMSVVKGLSSYNFAVFDIMQKAVAFIRDPRNSFFSGKTVLECEGMVVARESSGRVRRTG